MSKYFGKIHAVPPKVADEPQATGEEHCIEIIACPPDADLDFVDELVAMEAAGGIEKIGEHADGRTFFKRFVDPNYEWEPGDDDAE